MATYLLMPYVVWLIAKDFHWVQKSDHLWVRPCSRRMVRLVTEKVDSEWKSVHTDRLACSCSLTIGNRIKATRCLWMPSSPHREKLLWASSDWGVFRLTPHAHWLVPELVHAECSQCRSGTMPLGFTDSSPERQKKWSVGKAVLARTVSWGIWRFTGLSSATHNADANHVTTNMPVAQRNTKTSGTDGSWMWEYE